MKTMPRIRAAISIGAIACAPLLMGQVQFPFTQCTPIISTWQNQGLGPAYNCGANPLFRLEVQGDVTFSSDNWGEGIRLLSPPSVVNRGSGIVWDRLIWDNSYFITGPQNGGQATTGDFFTGLVRDLDPNGANATPVYISRIHGNHDNTANSGLPNYAGTDPRMGHTQYYRDFYVLGRTPTAPIPRLGVNVGTGITAHLHVGNVRGGLGTVRFQALDPTIVPTRTIVCDNDGNLTYSNTLPGTGGITNSCGVSGTIPKDDGSGNLACSIITENSNRIGISNPSPGVNYKLDVNGNINGAGYVNAGNILAGFSLGSGNRVLAHGDALGVGYNAGLSGLFNVNVGDGAGQNQTFAGEYNTNVGRLAGSLNVTGSSNTLIGSSAGQNVTAGLNTMVGALAGFIATNSEYNTLIGYKAGERLTTGEENTVIGGAYGGWWGSGTDGTNAATLQNIGTFGFDTRVTTSHTQRFGDARVLRWGFGIDPNVANRIMRVHLPGTSTACGGPCVEAFMDPGGVWNSVSDAELKTDFEDVDHAAVLAAVLEMPVTEWSYTEDPGIRHIGPMAQDFYAAFGLGHGETTISTLDPNGVALSAIKGLGTQVEDLRRQIRDLEEALAHCCERRDERSMTAGSEGGEQARLDQNQPNPFREQAMIHYYVPKGASQAEIQFFSVEGDRIRTERIGSGAGRVVIDGGSLTAGTYVYALIIEGKHIDSKLMVLTR